MLIFDCIKSTNDPTIIAFFFIFFTTYEFDIYYKIMNNVFCILSGMTRDVFMSFYRCVKEWINSKNVFSVLFFIGVDALRSVCCRGFNSSLWQTLQKPQTHLSCSHKPSQMQCTHRPSFHTHKLKTAQQPLITHPLKCVVQTLDITLRHHIF